MRDVIAHDEIDVKFAPHDGLDLVEEPAELGSKVASIALADDPSGRIIEVSEYRPSPGPGPAWPSFLVLNAFRASQYDPGS